MMKKLCSLLTICALLLSAVSALAEPNPTPNFAPDVTETPVYSPYANPFEDEPMDVPIDIPIDEPLEPTPVPAEDAPEDVPASEGAEGEGDSTPMTIFDEYSGPQVTLEFETLTNSTYNLTLDRPSAWSQIPGRYTICYAETVAPGQTPARMALTRKVLSSSPNEDRITKQLISYLKALQTQYDSFEVGDLDTETPFMGQTGYSTVYTGKKGETSVRGYVIMCAIERRLFVFHFSASESAYASYGSVMVHLRDSVKINEKK